MLLVLQLALHAVRAAEEALLHHLSEAEEGAPVVAASLAELFGAAHGALRAAPALFQLRLAALMPMSQLADALLRHLCVDDDGAASASAQVWTNCKSGSLMDLARDCLVCRLASDQGPCHPGFVIHHSAACVLLLAQKSAACVLLFAHHLQRWWAAPTACRLQPAISSRLPGHLQMTHA